MKPTFSTLGCHELALDEVIALAHELGCDAVELRHLAGSTDLVAAFGERFGSPERLAAHLDTAGVGIAVFDSSLALPTTDAAARRELTALAPWAEAVGCRWLRVFDGGRFTGAIDADYLAAARDTIAWWRGERAAHGWQVDIAVETHDALCSAATITAFQREFAEPVPILWDAHHTWFKNEEDPLATWAAIRERVVHVHVKDSVREPILQYPYTYVVPGRGAFPLADLLARLDADGYAGRVCLEWERAWHPYLPELREAWAGLADLR